MPKNFIKSRMFYVYAGIIFAFLVLGFCGSFILASDSPHTTHQDAAVDKTYYTLPRFMVDMNGGDGTSHVQFDVSLEIARKDRRVLIGYQPRIIDKLNLYLSQERAEELKNQNSVAKMRREMLQEVNNAGAPVKVYDLILREIIVM